MDVLTEAALLSEPELLTRSAEVLRVLRGRLVSLWHANRITYLSGGRFLPNDQDHEAGAVIRAYGKLERAVAAIVDAEKVEV